MVEITPAEKHLIGWLKFMGVEEDEMIGIMLLMDTPFKRDELMMWMSKHEKATPSDIIGKALEISKWDVRQVFQCPSKAQVQEFFDLILPELKLSKIKTIFVLDSNERRDRLKGALTYHLSSRVYILLENEWCLIVEYFSIGGLIAQFRKLAQSEIEEYEKMQEKDLFNIDANPEDVSVSLLCLNHNFKLEYGSIEEISLEPITEKYAKWADGNFVYVNPTKETFNKIKFTMNNGKTFIIRPEEDESGRYTIIWSDDTEETI